MEATYSTDNLNTITINENSFTFEVEQGFKPELDNLFIKNTKDYHEGNGFPVKQFDEEGEGFHFFDTKNNLIEGYYQAWIHNFPMIISPDIIWLLIMQNFSTHMSFYSEKLRHNFVDFQGKKEIIVHTEKGLIKEQTAEDWFNLIEKTIKDMEKYLGSQMMNLLNPCFSTATKISSLCNKISVMCSMKSFFKYVHKGEGCSVTKMTVEGSPDDWKKIKERLNFLGTLDYDLKKYSTALLPIIDKIIDTVENKKVDKEFWRNFIKKKIIGEHDYLLDRNSLDGWLIKFFIYDKYKHYLSPDQPLPIANVPDSVYAVPIVIVENEETYEGKIETGFFGFRQDKVSLAVKPVIGFKVYCYDEKEKEEKEVDKKAKKNKKYEIKSKEVIKLTTKTEKVKTNFKNSLNVMKNLFEDYNTAQDMKIDDEREKEVEEEYEI